MEYRPPAGPVLRALYVAFGLSVGLTVVTGYRALRLGPLPGPTPGSGPASVATPQPRKAAPLWDAVRAVEKDPFNPARRAPERRYLLPEEQAVASPPDQHPQASGTLRLVGTAVTGDGGGFAMCQIGRDPPKVLHVGDQLGELTLRSIARGQAEFARADGSVVTLKVAGSS